MDPHSLIRHAIASASDRPRGGLQPVVTAIVSLFLLLAVVDAAPAGPCTREILKMQAALDALAASSPEKTAHQSIAAQRHRQPTPRSVSRGWRQARADERHDRLALARARSADTRGDATACQRALAEARMSSSNQRVRPRARP